MARFVGLNTYRLLRRLCLIDVDVARYRTVGLCGTDVAPHIALELYSGSGDSPDDGSE